MDAQPGNVPKLEHTKLTDSSQVNLWSVDRNFNYTFFNDLHQKDMKSVWGVDIEIGKNVLEYINDKNYRADVEKTYISLLEGNPHRSKDHFTLKTGEELFYENFGQAVRDNKGRITGIMFYTVNTTRKTDMENRLKLSISLLKSIMNSPDDIHILSIDKQYRYLFFNNAHKNAMREVWETTPETGVNILTLLPDKKHRDRVKIYYDRALGGEIIRQNSKFTDRYGKIKYYDNISAPIHDAKGEITGITVFTINITDKEIAAEQINRSLAEKEVLLKEIHHRVKNNLQLVSSMIGLQLNHVNDERINAILNDSLNRIATMSNIHKMLYQGEDLSRIEMQPYCQRLVDSVMELFGCSKEHIKIDLNIAPVSLELDQAIPLSLIINELLTNSLKYAFEQNDDGIISMLFEEDINGLHLQVKDNGRGLPEEKPVENGSLGFEVINIFTTQLGGKVEFKSYNGLTVDIYFT